MKMRGTQIKGYKVRNGELVKTDKTPAPLRKGKHAKAARQAKAWKAKSRNA